MEPQPPAVDSHDEVYPLESEVGIKLSLKKEDGEEDVVRETDRPVPDAPPSDEPDADSSSHESESFC